MTKSPKMCVGGSRPWLRLRITVAASLLAFSASAACHAQDAKIRSSFEPTDQKLFIGQKGTLVVELLVPGYFSGTPVFDLPSMAGAVLVPPTGSPVVSSEDVDGATYAVQRHELAVFFHRAGQQTVAPFHVRFAFKRSPLDKDAVAADLTTDAISIAVTTPPGAEHLPGLICANDLTVDEQWTPEPGDAKAGDAFTRTITFSANEIPGMAFPPFPAGSIDGVRTYRQEPQVLDESNRGRLEGKRRDSITYVCQRAGQFTIPAIRLTWWDLDDAQLKAIDLPARVLRVAGNKPDAAEHQATADGTRDSIARLRSTEAAPWVMAAILTLVAVAWLTARSHWPRRVSNYYRPVRLGPLNPTPDS